MWPGKACDVIVMRRLLLLEAPAAPLVADVAQGLVHKAVQVLHLLAVYAGRALYEQRGCRECTSAGSGFRCSVRAFGG